MSESKGLSAFQSHRDGLKADLTTTSAIAHAQIALQVLWVKESSHRTRFCSELSPTEFGTGASLEASGFRLGGKLGVQIASCPEGMWPAGT